MIHLDQGLAVRPTLYVDTAGGSDTRTGASPASALATVQAAVNLLAGVGGGTILLTAGDSDPVDGLVVLNKFFPVTIRALSGTAYWTAGADAGCVWAYGKGQVTLEGLDLSGGTSGPVIVGYTAAATGSGLLTATDCTMHDASGANGVNLQGIWTDVLLTRCDLSDNANDGCSAHCTAGTPTIELVDCTGSGNADEWASPHETVTMNVVGGSSTGNAHGALAAAGTAVLNVTGFTSTGDYTDARENNEGVITFIDTGTTGSLTNVTVTDSPGAPGVIIKAGASVSRSGLISTGNNGADDYAA